MISLDLDLFLREFRAEAEERGFKCETLDETSAGPVLGFTSSCTARPAYLSAGIHGDEPAGPLAVLRLLRGGCFDGSARAWTICPALNPTGLTAGTRENSDGKDLNRDYLSLETSEVQAHVRWLKSLPTPELFISLHEDWESTGFYFYEINTGPDLPERAKSILNAAGRWLPSEKAAVIDDHAVRSSGWIYHEAEADFPDHWPEAIYLAKSGCPLSFTFETPSSADLEKRILAHMAAVEEIARA